MPSAEGWHTGGKRCNRMKGKLGRCTQIWCYYGLASLAVLLVAGSSTGGVSDRRPRAVILTNQTDPYAVYLAGALEARYGVTYVPNDSEVSYNKTSMDVLFLPASTAGPPYPLSYTLAARFLEAGGSIVLLSYATPLPATQYITNVLTAAFPGSTAAWDPYLNLTVCIGATLTQASTAPYNANHRTPVIPRGSSDSTPITFPDPLGATLASRGVKTLGCAGSVTDFHAMYLDSNGQALVEFATRGAGTLYYMSYSWDDEGGNPKTGWGELAAALVLEAYSKGGAVAASPSASVAPGGPDLQPGSLTAASLEGAQGSFLPVSRGRPSWTSGGALTGLARLTSPVAPFNPVKTWDINATCHSVSGASASLGALWVAFDLGLVRPVVRAAVQQVQLGVNGTSVQKFVQLEVRVSNASFSGDASSGTALCGGTAFFATTEQPRPTRVSCLAGPSSVSASVLGRYVAVRLLDPLGQLAAAYPNLRMCGVDVWALAASKDQDPVAVASRHRPVCAGGPDTPAGDVFASRPPDNTSGLLAVDGLYLDNRAGAGAGMCAVSYPKDGPWFTVDVGAPKEILWVELTKSADLEYDEQLQNVFVVVHNRTTSGCGAFGSYTDAEVLALPVCGGVSESSGSGGLRLRAGDTTAAECNGGSGHLGRLVTVYRPPKSRSIAYGYYGALRLCELDVYVRRPAYGLQQVSYNRPVDYGPTSAVLDPSALTVVSSAAYDYNPGALLTDGVATVSTTLCPRVYDPSTTSTSYAANSGPFVLVDLGHTRGGEGYEVEAVVLTLALNPRTDARDQVATELSVYVGNTPAGSVYDPNGIPTDNAVCALRAGLLSAVHPLDDTWYLNGSLANTARRRFDCGGVIGRYVILMAPAPWQYGSGSGALTWLSPALCEVEVYARVPTAVPGSLTLVGWRPTWGSIAASAPASVPFLALRNANSPIRRLSRPPPDNEYASCAFINGSTAQSNFWVMDLQAAERVAFVRLLGSQVTTMSVAVAVLPASWNSSAHPADAVAAGMGIVCFASGYPTQPVLTSDASRTNGSVEAVCRTTNGSLAGGRYVVVYDTATNPLLLCGALVYVDTGTATSEEDRSRGDIPGYGGLVYDPTTAAAVQATLATLGGGVVLAGQTTRVATGRVPESLDTAPWEFTPSPPPSLSPPVPGLASSPPPVRAGRRRQARATPSIHSSFITRGGMNPADGAPLLPGSLTVGGGGKCGCAGGCAGRSAGALDPPVDCGGSGGAHGAGAGAGGPGDLGPQAAAAAAEAEAEAAAEAAAEAEAEEEAEAATGRCCSALRESPRTRGAYKQASSYIYEYDEYDDFDDRYVAEVDQERGPGNYGAHDPTTWTRQQQQQQQGWGQGEAMSVHQGFEDVSTEEGEELSKGATTGSDAAVWRRRRRLARDPSEGRQQGRRRQLQFAPANTSMWRVDLGGPRRVAFVVLAVQVDTSSFVVYDKIQILVSNSSSAAAGVIVTSSGRINLLKESHSFDCGGAVGRYVYVNRTVAYALPLTSVSVSMVAAGSDGLVASGRPTSQAGGVVTGPGGSANAVNGYFSQAAVDAAGRADLYFGSSTAPSTAPWWAVDLGVTLPLVAVEITAAGLPGAQSGGVPAGFELRVVNGSVVSGDEGVVVLAAGPSIPPGTTARFDLPRSTPSGRQLVVRLPPLPSGSASQTLQLGQVELMANATRLAADSANSGALSATREYDSAVTRVDGVLTAPLVADGLASPAEPAKCAFVSGGVGATGASWLTLDLGSSQSVRRVELLKPLGASFSGHSSSLELRLGLLEPAEAGDGDENPVVMAGPLGLAAGSVSVLYLPPLPPSPARAGRFLTVRSTNGSPLALCEMAAYGPSAYDILTPLPPPSPMPPSPSPPQSPTASLIPGTSLPSQSPASVDPSPSAISPSPSSSPSDTTSQSPPPANATRPSTSAAPPAPVVYQVGKIEGDAKGVQAAAAATIAATIAATTAASVASGFAASIGASAVGGAVGGAAGAGAGGGAGLGGMGAAGSSFSSGGAVAASLMVSHLQFFALTPYAATNSTQQYRQMNSQLSWLNLGFNTISMRNVPREVAASYNQVLNSALLQAGVLALHYLLFLLFRNWRKLKSWSLPGWLAFPFPEIFVLTFNLSGLSASATMLLGAAVVGNGWQPAVVGSMVAAFIVAFAAAAAWLVYRIFKIYRKLGMVYMPRSAAYAVPQHVPVNADGVAGIVGAAAATLATVAADGASRANSHGRDSPKGRGGGGTPKAGPYSPAGAPAAPKGAVAEANERQPPRWNAGASARDLAAVGAAAPRGSEARAAQRPLRPRSGSDGDDNAAAVGRHPSAAAASTAASARAILLEPDEATAESMSDGSAGGGGRGRAAVVADGSTAAGADVKGARGPPAVAVGIISTVSGSRSESGSWPSPGTEKGRSPGKGQDGAGSSPEEATVAVQQTASGRQTAGGEGRGKAGDQSEEGEEDREGDKKGEDDKKGELTGFRRWFSRLLLGRWNREEAVALYRGMEPHRTRKYLKDGLGPRAAIRCLYPRDFAAEAAAERQELRRRRRERRIAATSGGASAAAGARAGVMSGRARSPPFSGVGSVSGGSAGSDPDGGSGPLEGRSSSRTAWAGLGAGAPGDPSRTATTSRFAAAGPPAPGLGPGTGQGQSAGYLLRGSAPWLVRATGGQGEQTEPRNLSYTGGGLQRSGARDPGPAAGPSGWSRLGGPTAAPEPPSKSRTDGKDSRPPWRPAGVNHSIISTGPAHLLHPTGAAMPIPPAAPLPPPPAPPPPALMPLSPLLQAAGDDPGPSSASSNPSVGSGSGRPPRPMGPSRVTAGSSRSPLRHSNATSSLGGGGGGSGNGRAPAAADPTEAMTVAAVAAPPPLRGAAVLPPPLLLTHGSAGPSPVFAADGVDVPPNVLLSPTRSEPWPVASRQNDFPGFRPGGVTSAATAGTAPGAASGVTPASPPPQDGDAAGTPEAPAAAPQQTPAFMALLSFGVNANADAYITGGGPRLLGSGGNSRASLAARPLSAGGRNSATGGPATDDEDSFGGDSGYDAGGRRIMPRRRGSADSFVSRPVAVSSPGGEAAAAITGPPVGTFLGGGFESPSSPLAGTASTGTAGTAPAAVGASMLSYGGLPSQHFYLKAAPGGPGPRNVVDKGGNGSASSSTSEDESSGDEVMDAEKRCLLARLEVYERYGLTFEENRGNRRLAAMFYIAVVLNAVIPGLLLGVQAGGQMATGSTAALATNISLLVFKASYSLYLTLVLPYINVILIGSEMICTWLETIVVVCMVIITVSSPSTTSATDVLSATTVNTTATATSGNSTVTSSSTSSAQVDDRIARSGDAMLVCELVVLAVQIVAMLITTIIPAGFAIVLVVRMRLAHNRAKRARRAREAADRAAAGEAGEAFEGKKEEERMKGGSEEKKKAEIKEWQPSSKRVTSQKDLGVHVGAGNGTGVGGGDRGGVGGDEKGAEGAGGSGSGGLMTGVSGDKVAGALASPKLQAGQAAV